MKSGLEVASPRSRMYYTERNFKPITRNIDEPLVLEEDCVSLYSKEESLRISWCTFGFECPRCVNLALDCSTLHLHETWWFR
jgi:hypothetical protein